MLRLMMEALKMEAREVPPEVRPAWQALIAASIAQKAIAAEMRAMPRRCAASKNAWKEHDAKAAGVNAALIAAFGSYVVSRGKHLTAGTVPAS